MSLSRRQFEEEVLAVASHRACLTIDQAKWACRNAFRGRHPDDFTFWLWVVSPDTYHEMAVRGARLRKRIESSN